jgi:hypothetical protein
MSGNYQIDRCMNSTQVKIHGESRTASPIRHWDKSLSATGWK